MFRPESADRLAVERPHNGLAVIRNVEQVATRPFEGSQGQYAVTIAWMISTKRNLHSLRWASRPINCMGSAVREAVQNSDSCAFLAELGVPTKFLTPCRI